MAAPTFRAISSVSGASATSISFSKPTGTAQNDIIVAVFYTEATTAVTPPTGFTKWIEQASGAGGGAAFHLHAWWKRAGASESGPYAFSWSGSHWRNGACYAIQGATTSGDPAELTTSAAAAAGNPATCPDVSLTTTQTDLLIYGGCNSTGGSWTPATGMTERYDGGDDFTTDSLGQSAAGSTGNLHAQCSSGANATSASLLLAIQPPSVGGSTTNITVSATQAQSGVVLRLVTHKLTATQAQSNIATRQVTKALSGTQSSTATLARQAGHTLTTTQAQSGAVSRAVAHVLAATQAQSGVVNASRAFLLTLTTTVTQTATLTRQVSHTLAASQAQSASLTRRITHLLAATQAQAGTVARQITHTLVATQAQSATAAVGRLYQIVLTATQATSAAVVLEFTQAVFKRLVFHITGRNTPVHPSGGRTTAHTRSSQKRTRPD